VSAVAESLSQDISHVVCNCKTQSNRECERITDCSKPADCPIRRAETRGFVLKMLLKA
jgi:hypothetical protein